MKDKKPKSIAYDMSAMFAKIPAGPIDKKLFNKVLNKAKDDEYRRAMAIRNGADPLKV